MKSAASTAAYKGWGHIVAWLEQNSREIMQGGCHTPEDGASSHSVCDDDAALYLNLSRAVVVGTGRESRTPDLKPQHWPVRELEVDASSKNKPEKWVRMDPDMADAIAKRASNGDAVFEIVVGDWKNLWHYRFDFTALTQTNLDSGTVRRLRLPTH